MYQLYCTYWLDRDRLYPTVWLDMYQLYRIYWLDRDRLYPTVWLDMYQLYRTYWLDKDRLPHCLAGQGLAVSCILNGHWTGYHPHAGGGGLVESLGGLAGALARHTGQEEKEVLRHQWGSLAISLQRGNAAILGNRISTYPGLAIDGQH